MSRTNDLKKVIKTKLDTLKTSDGLKEVYYQVASDKKLYPHVVFDLEQTTMLQNDNKRHDHKLIVDVYVQSTSSTVLDNITDDVEDLFNAMNIPQTTILPTFYLESRIAVPDEDKTIRHNQLKFTIQNYER